jgi:hypothetical protein
MPLKIKKGMWPNETLEKAMDFIEKRTLPKEGQQIMEHPNEFPY